VRSDIAARWSARFGYTNVKRYPGGIQEWKEHGGVLTGADTRDFNQKD